MYKLSLSDSWITPVETPIPDLPAVEGHTLVTFGDLLIRIGGCNPIENSCYNDIWAYKMLDSDEE